ncbi:hypothetical protein V1511DRAFT_461143 [Dipodascopsis uninucleata]
MSTEQNGQADPVPAPASDIEIKETENTQTENESRKWIGLRIKSPIAIPPDVEERLLLEVPVDETVLTVKQMIAQQLFGIFMNDHEINGRGGSIFRINSRDEDEMAALEALQKTTESTEHAKSDTGIRLIFRGRFLTNELKISEVVAGQDTDSDSVTFHMVLRPALVEIFERFNRSQRTPDFSNRSSEGVSQTQMFATNIENSTVDVQSEPVSTDTRAIGSPPLGTNIIIYQDPQVAAPLLSPSTTFPVRTNTGQLALLLSPQGITNFLAAGIDIRPGNSALVPGIGASARETSSNIFNDLAHPSFHRTLEQQPLPNQYYHVINYDQQARQRVHNRHVHDIGAYENRGPRDFTLSSLFRRIRAHITDIRNNANRLRAFIALSWLFLRLVFFVGLFSDDIGTSRFWVFAVLATVVFIWRSNLFSAAFGIWQDRNRERNENAPQQRNQRHERDVNAAGVRGAPLQDENNSDSIAAANSSIRDFRALRIVHRALMTALHVLVIFLATMIPNVYDQFLQVCQRREREQREQREQRDRQQDVPQGQQQDQESQNQRQEDLAADEIDEDGVRVNENWNRERDDLHHGELRLRRVI